MKNMVSRARKAALYLIMLFMFDLTAHAAESTRFKALAPLEQQQLTKGEVVVFLHSVNGPIKEGIAVGIVEAPVGEVFKVVTSNEKFSEFMPYVKESRIKMTPDGFRLNYQYLDLPFPVGDRHYTIKIHNSQEIKGSQRLLTSSWTYVKGSGNIKDTYGSWLLKPYGPNRTLAQYTVCTDPGGDIPTWAQNMATKISLPKVITCVRQRVKTLSEEKPLDNATGPAPNR